MILLYTGRNELLRLEPETVQNHRPPFTCLFIFLTVFWNLIPNLSPAEGMNRTHPTPRPEVRITAFAVNPNHPNELYAAVSTPDAGQGIYKSSDSGSFWRPTCPVIAFALGVNLLGAIRIVTLLQVV